MIRLFLTLSLLLFNISFLSSQESDAQDNLLHRANENYSLVFKNPEKAYQVSKSILREARRENNQEAELCAISTQCVYFESKNNFEELMNSAKLLYKQAEAYQNPEYQTSAKIDLFNAYAFNGLHDKAFEELKQAERIINKVNNKDIVTTLTKVNLYVAFSNYYLLQKDYLNQLKYVRLSAVEYEKFTDPKYRDRFRYIDYSNRSRVFADLKMIDSAEYYAKLSLLKENEFGRDDIQFSNYLVLGRVATEKGNYIEAIGYFKEAEKIDSYKNHLNLLTLYDNVIYAYTMLNESEKMRDYEARRDSLKLSISENQNKSLHSLINEMGSDSTNKYLIFTLLGLLFLMAGIFFFIRKNKIINTQEKTSSEYLKDNPQNKSGEDYSRLLGMLKRNDPAFITYFSEVFPHFTPKLLKINPNLNQADIEFCALLKLNIPTNDIARFQFITLKSVQNKKYNIRKKLNIPKGIDIYNWFSLL